MDVSDLETRLAKARSDREYSDLRYRLYVAKARARRDAGEGEDAEWDEYTAFTHDVDAFREKQREAEATKSVRPPCQHTFCRTATFTDAVEERKSRMRAPDTRLEDQVERALRETRTPRVAGRVATKKVRPTKPEPSPIERIAKMAGVRRPATPAVPTLESLQKKARVV